MYEYSFSGENDIMNLDMYNFLQEELETKEMMDILDLDKMSTENQNNVTENQSDKIFTVPEDFYPCFKPNECPSSRTSQEDYSFEFLYPVEDISDYSWNKTNNFTNYANNEMPEFVENYSYSALPPVYSDVTEIDEPSLSNASNSPQNYNFLLWNHQMPRTDSAPVALANTKKTLNISDTNDTLKKVLVDQANKSYSGPCNPSQQGAKNIENINALQSKQGTSFENEQVNSPNKNVLRIVLKNQMDTQSGNQNNETVKRYKVIFPATKTSRFSLPTFKTQKEGAQKERIISVPEAKLEKLQNSDAIPGTKTAQFFCLICEEKCVTRNSLITHMKSHRQPFCSFCITLYKTREQLRQHINRLHVTPEPPEVAVVTSKYGRKRQVFCPLSMTRRRSINKSMKQ